MKTLSSSFEGRLVDYYDFFFHSEERVIQEINYIDSFFNNSEDLKNKKLVDIGCGTGLHDYHFADNFYSVLGIDISSDMIKYADRVHKKENVEYICKSIADYESQDIFYECAVSLSHVIGYQLSNDLLEGYLNAINHLLMDKGIFVFNFYHQPGLNNLKPRHVKKSKENVVIERLSNAEINPVSNCLDLEYFYLITEDNDVETYRIQEKMRYYTMLELEFELKTTGFEVLGFYNYLTNDKLKASDWNGLCVARKAR